MAKGKLINKISAMLQGVHIDGHTQAMLGLEQQVEIIDIACEEIMKAHQKEMEALVGEINDGLTELRDKRKEESNVHSDFFVGEEYAFNSISKRVKEIAQKRGLNIKS